MNKQEAKTKSCISCEKQGRNSVHPVSNFGLKLGTKDGLQPYCKACMNEKQKEYNQRKRTGSLNRSYSRRGADDQSEDARVGLVRHMAAIDDHGGKCECCEEDQIEFLVLCTKISNRLVEPRGHTLKNKELYQVLCSSCANAMSNYGYCPHKDKSSSTSTASLRSMLNKLDARR